MVNRNNFHQSVEMENIVLRGKTLHEHFHQLALLDGKRDLFTFVNNSAEEIQTITVGTLDSLAQKAANYLSSLGLKVGEKCVLLCNPGFDFIVAFLGCLYAGIIAVPRFYRNYSFLVIHHLTINTWRRF
jgi:acyl-CoA synthetase (AMP-forming)/AMP-acid ligase II